MLLHLQISRGDVMRSCEEDVSMKSSFIAMGALASALVSSVVTPSWAAVTRTTFRGENAGDLTVTR
jgi:hypothetical protein